MCVCGGGGVAIHGMVCVCGGGVLHSNPKEKDPEAAHGARRRFGLDRRGVREFMRVSVCVCVGGVVSTSPNRTKPVQTVKYR